MTGNMDSFSIRGAIGSYRWMTPSNGASGDNLTCAMLVPSAIRVISIGFEQRSEYANVSAVHDAFTSIPPLARRPRKLPSLQSSGSAGRSRINPSWLCRSISDNAAGKPRLPSIWNGGCAHRPLSYTPPPSRSVSASVSTGRRNMPMMRSACSASLRRAHMIMRQTMLQPEPSSPRISRDFLAAFSKRGVFDVMPTPGYSSYRCDR